MHHLSKGDIFTESVSLGIIVTLVNLTFSSDFSLTHVQSEGHQKRRKVVGTLACSMHFRKLMGHITPEACCVQVPKTTLTMGT